MNHIRWAAWGVIDIEALDRMQRRNYIKRARVELAEKSVILECGGSTQTPWYGVIVGVHKHTAAGKEAFRKVCEWLLKELDDHVSSEDGSIRRAGAEA